MRLIAGGCSFTSYIWPTWADYASLHYSDFLRVGRPGADNATIAREVIAHAGAGDIVVIMWSGYDRWNNYRDGKWQAEGCIAANKSFFVGHFSHVERFATTMDYIYMVELHAHMYGYTVHHFSAFPFFQSEFLKIHDYVPRKTNYDRFSDKLVYNHLLTQSLAEYQIANKQDWKTSHQFDPGDEHPTPITHWQYFTKIMAPKLSLTVDLSYEETVQYEQSRVMSGDVTPWLEYDLLILDD